MKKENNNPKFIQENSIGRWNIHCPWCDSPIDSIPRVRIYKRLLKMCKRGRTKAEEQVNKLKRKVEILQASNNRMKAEIIVLEQAQLTCSCGEKE